MRGYGQFCPVAKAAELFCERWTPLVIRDLAAGATRFSELQRGVPLMSPSLLSRRLKQLAAEGVVERRRAARGWTYHLTPAGVEFVPLVEGLGAWGQRWSRRELVEAEVDLGLLLWSIERAARADAFGHDRAVVRLELADQPGGKALWWFLNEGPRCTLCLERPRLRGRPLPRRDAARHDLRDPRRPAARPRPRERPPRGAGLPPPPAAPSGAG